MRLINAESDGLPGLVADVYVGRADGDDGPRLAVIVVQALTLGVEQRKAELAHSLEQALKPGLLPELGDWQELLVYERSDVDVRQLEGLAARSGPMVGGLPPERLVIEESGLLFRVDVLHGHKTGLYLDQRLNRSRVAAYCREADVLNCFAYNGGFSVQALAAGAARVTDVETSAAALEQGRRNTAINGLPLDRREEAAGDVFKVLRSYRDQGRQFDVVILDPPKFARRAGQVQAACRGYKDINLLAMGILREGGTLVTFSCSGLVPAELFQKVVFGAAVDAGRDVQILESLSQAPDHPVLLTFPESRYLNGFICRVW
jgi:23S rRNA (cytosine1962-C5)-methyltransferase